MNIPTETIVEFIRREVRPGFSIERVQVVGGGSINRCYHVSGQSEDYFVKVNRASEIGNFEAESGGLKLLSQNDSLVVPNPITSGIIDGHCLLVLQFLDLHPVSQSGAELLGRGLAEQHRIVSDKFGLEHDNFIGLTTQSNRQTADWVQFIRDDRLAPQFEMAVSRGCPGSLVDTSDQLFDVLPQFFDNYHPAPSLLHGDLWGGNVAEVDGLPAIFDPAVYFGDREADIAMTELFGGFPGRFYAAYREAMPMDPGYEIRRHLYNLYHVLNHFNLFGGGYAAQAERMAIMLISEICD